LRLPAALAAVLLLGAAPGQAETVYRCVRPDGSVALSQVPPAPGSCVQQSTTEWTSSPEPAAPDAPARGDAPAPTSPAAAPSSGTPAPSNGPAARPDPSTSRFALWERRQGSGPWRTIDVFVSEQGCLAERDERATAVRSLLVDAVIDEPGTVMHRGAEHVRYQCLPRGTPPA